MKDNKRTVERNVSSKLNNKVFCRLSTEDLTEMCKAIVKLNGNGFANMNQPLFIRASITWFSESVLNGDIQLGLTFRSKTKGKIKSKCVRSEK